MSADEHVSGSGLTSRWTRFVVVSLALALVTAVTDANAAQRSLLAPPAPLRWDTATYAAPDSQLAFVGTTVIDVRRGKLRPNQTVVVVGRRIQAVGPAGRVHIPAEAKAIHADGTFLIPGIWDMHTHLFGWARHYYPFLIANGVMGIREMSTFVLDSTLRWRKEVAAGHMAGPRVVTPGPAVFGGPQTSGSWPWGVFPATPAEGRHVVDSLQAAGVDFIKPYDLPRDIALAVADEAKRVGLPLAGHQLVESAAESSELGERSIEHRVFCHERAPSGSVLTGAPSDPEECTALAATFRRNGTYYGWGPFIDLFLPLYGACGDLDCTRYFPVDRNRYMPQPHDSAFDRVWDTIERPPVRTPCLEERCSLAGWARVAGAGSSIRDMYDNTLRVYHAGIPFLLGSDAGAASIQGPPGAIIHNMMWMLAAVGFTPLDALRAGTWNPVVYLHATDSLGAIEAGKLADFVFLDANPLVDIYNTRRIRAVVANGRFFDRGTLDQMLIDTEERAMRDRIEYLKRRRGP